MSTFGELQERLKHAKTRKAVLEHVVDYLETQFRPMAGSTVKRVLLTEEKAPVPDETYESLIVDMLGQIGELDREIQGILQSALMQNAEVEMPQETQGYPQVPPQGDVQ